MKKKGIKSNILITSILLVLAISGGVYLAIPSTEEFSIPKPKGYLRVALPQNNYATYKAACPFEFDYSEMAKVMKQRQHQANPCWLDIYYPQFRATLHLTYTPVDTNLYILAEDSRELAMKHIVKANDIQSSEVRRNRDRVFGVIYDFDGSTATNYQFFLTDSSQHFVRGALYFNLIPNPDSLEPVVAFIKSDLERMIRSFRWSESGS